MSRLQGELEPREADLVTREVELNRRETRMRRLSAERADAMDARELQLNRRETALATLASELAAERERLTEARKELLAELRRLDRRRVQSSPRWFAVPDANESTEHEDRWWAKVRGREPV
jgi:chromosome segregation ATPase